MRFSLFAAAAHADTRFIYSGSIRAHYTRPMRKILRFNGFACAVLTALLFCSPKLHADTIYTTTASVSLQQLSTNFTPDATGGFFETTVFSAQNTGATTLSNLYFLADEEYLNGLASTLTGPGVFSTSTGPTADQVNAAAFATASQTNASPLIASGSPTIPEIPLFLISQSLAPGQTVSFTKEFNLSAGTDSIYTDYFLVTGTSVTPEPSSFLLLGTGLLGMAGAMRKRLPRRCTPESPGFSPVPSRTASR